MSSKPLSDAGKETGAYIDHVYYLAENLGGTVTYHSLLNGEFELTLILPTVPAEARRLIGKGEVTVKVTLVLSENQDFWVLQNFEIKPSNPNTEKILLSGEKLLAHHGKRFTGTTLDFREPNRETWLIYCARDLDALFEAYDKLARKWGRLGLFGN